jgi:hypothetical protein
VAVSAGFLSTAVLMQSGQLYTFGGAFGRLTVPTLVAAPQGKRIASVSTDGDHIVAITTGDGACYSWGHGDYGKLGHGDDEDCFLPKQVEALAGMRVSAVATGGQHSAAITTEGDLFTWGERSDFFPQLGLGTADDSVNSPTAVPRVGGIPWGTAAPAAAGTAEPLPVTYAALSTLMRGTNVLELDDTAMASLDERITRVHDDLASKRTVVKSELTRRRCAEEVAKAQPDLVCPISHALMRNPVTAADGHSYERREIEQWCAGGSRKSPMAGVDVATTTLYPCITLKKAIERAMEAELAAGASGSGAGAEEEEGANNADRR